MKKEGYKGSVRWLEKCRFCGKSHYWTIGTCPSCGTPVPRKVSEYACWENEECDGCQEYRDHTR